MKTAAWFQMMIMAFQYMKGRKLRTLLTTLAVVFGVALIFAFNLVLPSAQEAFRSNIEGEREAVDLNITSVTGEGFQPAEALSTVAEIEGVEAVTGILQRRAALPDGFHPTYDQIQLSGVDPATIEQVREYSLKEGRFLTAEDTGVMIVPDGVAEVGDTFSLLTTDGVQPYQVVGVLDEAPINPVLPHLLITLPDAQAIVNQPGLINLIQVKYAEEVDDTRLTLQIERALGPQFVTNAKSEDLASFEIGMTILSLFGVVALFLGGFLIFNTFRTVIIERQRDLGMLRAMGATRRQIMQLILIESLLQGVIGTFIGLVVGYFFSLLMTSFINGIWGQFIGSFDLRLEFQPKALILAVVMGLAVTLVAGYFPARHASHTAPLAALRPASMSAVRRVARWGLYLGIALMVLSLILLTGTEASAPAGAVIFLIGAVIAAPGLVVPAARLFDPILLLWFARESDLARSNMVRQPGRASITASTLMIGLAVLILLAALVSGFNAMVDNMVGTSFASDVLLMPQVIAIYNNVIGADESLKEDLLALPEVETVSDLRYASSFYEGNRLNVFGIDPVTYPQVTDLEFKAGKSEEAYPALSSGRNVIINTMASLTLGVEEGDDFELQTAEGPQTYRVVGIANDLLHMKIPSIMASQDNLAADFHKTESVLLMVNLEPGADEQAALTNIRAVAQNYPQFQVNLTRTYVDDMVELTTGIMKVFYVLAALILIPAALGLLNTLTINILERTREIGVVRAIGASRRQVQRMVVAEALMLGLFGAALGVLAGVAMAYGFTAAFSTIDWDVPFIFPVMGIIAAVIIAILLALFSSILPARNAAKLDIIQALQYE